MLHSIVAFLWGSAIAEFGIAVVILAISVAVWFYSPVVLVRHVAVGVGVGALVFLFVGVKFYAEGVKHERDKWTKAEQATIKEGNAARTSATSDAANPRMRDPFDSDQ